MACWKSVKKYVLMQNDDDVFNDDDDGSGSVVDSLLWFRDLERHCFGEFSFAVVQANEVIEDHSQVEIGRDATFVGIYDGHGGPEASRFVCNHIFKHFTRFAQERGTVSGEILRSAVSATEDGFITLVSRTFELKPLIAAIGTCCLVGVIWRGTLYVANLGDSRAVIGCLGRCNRISAEQLTRDHNASSAEVRRELTSLHPDDPQIVVMKNGAWRVKGIIQVSRSIGDAYLKRSEFSLDPSFPRFHLPEPLCRPVLSSEPSIYSRVLQSNDKFLIFASDGLWEHVTNQEAVQIVHNNPHTGIARRLVKTAMNVAARKRDMKYDALKKVDKARRRSIHDDITVIVIFIDNALLDNTMPVPEMSIRGFVDSAGPSNFNILEG